LLVLIKAKYFEKLEKMINSRKMTFNRFDYAAFLSYFIYAAGSVAVPVVLVLLARDLGFSLEHGGMSAGGALQLGRMASMVISMLLCGFIAGLWGKRLSFGWSIVLMGFGLGLCAITPSYGILFIAFFITGIGEGVLEGIATPFVQDLHPDESGRYLNFSHSFWSIGVMVTVLISGALLSVGISWRMIIGAVAVLSLIPALMLILPSKKGHEYPEHPEVIKYGTVLNHAIKIIKIPRFWIFFFGMFVAGGGEFCLTFWCASYIQLNFVPEAWAGGAGTACFAFGMVIGRTGWGYIIRQNQLRELLIGSALAGTFLTLFFPVLTNLWTFFGLLFLAGIATAPFWPSIQSYCADCLPETDTTMLFILLACAGIPGCGFFTWLMGYIGNINGDLSMAFYLVPGCFLILVILIGIDWFFHTSKKKM
jgi:MFS family permease